MHNVFRGPEAIRQFVDPALHAPVPLVELPPELHGVDIPGVHVFAKMMQMLPLGNVKSVPALSMLQRAEREGRLSPGTKLVESSSGNTVFSLALLGGAFGLGDVHAFASEEVSEGKLALLRLAGISVTLHCEPICPSPDDPNSGIMKARARGSQEGWINVDQYANSANPEGHERITAPQILAQLEGKVDIFAAGLGTTGTLTGTVRSLRTTCPDLWSVGVVRAANNPVPGVRTRALLAPTGFAYDTAVDILEEVGTHEAFATSLAMIRAGLLVGPSSGFALAGLRAALGRHRQEIEERVALQGAVNAVFICCDLPYPYIDEYMQFLPQEYFPPVVHEQEHRGYSHAQHHGMQMVEVSADEAFATLYGGLAVDEVWHRLHEGESVPLQDGQILWDLSEARTFAEYHAPGARAMTLDAVRAYAKLAPVAEETISILCPYGGISLEAVQILREGGHQARSISGGMLVWSKANFPRVKPIQCTR